MSTKNNDAYLTMQTVPLSAVTVDGSDQPNLDNDQLPSDPDQLQAQPNDNDEGNGGRVPSSSLTDAPPLIKKRPCWVRLAAESVTLPLLMLIPMIFLRMCFDYPLYPLNTIKGPAGLNEFRELERWSFFFAVSFFSIVAGQLLFRTLPWAINRICETMKRRLTVHEETAIACLSYAANYLGAALAILVIVHWAEYILYTPSEDLAARQLFSKLSSRDRVMAHDLLLGGRFESTLMAALVFVFILATEKYIVAIFQESFHRIALAPRIASCNAKFNVLGRLYRVRNPTRSTLSTITLTSLHAGGRGGETDELAPTRLAEDKGIDLSSVQRARSVARSIYKTLCPADRDYITSADFRPYFTIGEHEEAFQIFDVNRKGELDRSDFREAVEGIYAERFRTASALIANGDIVKKLDWTLLVVFSFFGGLLAMCMYNSGTFSWISSLGAFLLGFSFLFQTTVTKIFDTFLFVFVEHPYDVSDNVIVDGEKLMVRKIEVFTTIFKRHDGLAVYWPNSALKGKPIYNSQRRRSETDSIQFTISSTADIQKLTELRSKLTNHLTETFNEFTGDVVLDVEKFEGEGAGRKAWVQAAIKYRPREDDLRSDLTLHKRRAEVLDKFNALCSELGLAVTIESADK